MRGSDEWGGGERDEREMTGRKAERKRERGRREGER